MKKNNLRILAIALIVAISACKKEKDTTKDKKGNYDTKVLLENINSNIITPRYSAFSKAISQMDKSFKDFNKLGNEKNLATLKNNFKDAYIKWQGCSSFEFGPAENNILRATMNSFPADINKIKSNIASGTFDLSTSPNLPASGFPALDYMLFNQNETSLIKYYNER